MSFDARVLLFFQFSRKTNQTSRKLAGNHTEAFMILWPVVRSLLSLVMLYDRMSSLYFQRKKKKKSLLSPVLKLTNFKNRSFCALYAIRKFRVGKYSRTSEDKLVFYSVVGGHKISLWNWNSRHHWLPHMLRFWSVVQKGRGGKYIT